MARQFTRSAKKAKLWIGIPSTDVSLTTGATLVLAAIDFTSPQTVLRCMGEYVVSTNAAPTAGDAAKVTVGLARISTDASAVASAVPDPAGDVSYPWLYWAEHIFQYEATSQSSFDGVGAGRFHFDVHSMRKFTASESLALIIQYSDVSGAPALRLGFGQVRVLTTLH